MTTFETIKTIEKCIKSHFGGTCRRQATQTAVAGEARIYCCDSSACMKRAGKFAEFGASVLAILAGSSYVDEKKLIL